MSTHLSVRPKHGGNLVWAASLAGCSPGQLLDFSASVSPLGPPKAAIAAIQANLSQIKAYPDPSYHDLRVALSHHHQISPDWILPGNGSAELLTWASRDFSSLKGTALLTPAFGDYGRSLQAVSAPIWPVPLPVDKWLVHPEESADQALSEGLEALIAQILAQGLSPKAFGLLINNPHNPTGWRFSSQALLPYLRRFGLVVVDEAFMDFFPPLQQNSLIHQVRHFPNLVVLRSLTKFYSLPGLRMGYGIAHPQRLQRWQAWRDPWPVNALAAVAAIAALQDHDFQQASWRWIEEARSQLQQGLAQLPGLTPLNGSANYLLVGCDRSVTELQRQLLQRHRVLIRDCLSFEALGDRYFRVAVRTVSDNQKLIDALGAVII
ncbi:MAG: threonine-phosphate decarboxylase CobD [Cyanobacteria bacterium P01_D01_bin.128]